MVFEDPAREPTLIGIERVRAALPTEAADIALLVNHAYRPHEGREGWTHESNLVSGSRTTAQQVSEVLARVDSMLLVGLRDKRILACVQIDSERDQAMVGMLAVSPELQGSGIGSQMLLHAEDHAVRAFSARKITMLVVSSRHELLSFYLRRGYRQTGGTMAYPEDHGIGTPRKAGLSIERLIKHIDLTQAHYAKAGNTNAERPRLLGS